MTKLVDLNVVRAAWTKRYGAALCRRMMAGSGMAFDAMPPRRRARDQDPEEEGHPEGRPDPGGGGIEDVKDFIRQNMDPQAFAKLEQMLSALADGGEDEEDLIPTGGTRNVPEENLRETRGGGSPGRDSPPPFKGMPRPGGSKFGQDAASIDAYHDYFGTGYSAPSAERTFSDEWRNRRQQQRRR